jgi:hypothetical protein
LGIVDVAELRALAIDRWNSTQLRGQLEGDGVTVVAFGQGFASMSAPAKELERLVIAQQLCHGGNPVMAWMAASATVKADPAGNIKPVKPDRQRTGKRIDAMQTAGKPLGQDVVPDATRAIGAVAALEAAVDPGHENLVMPGASAGAAVEPGMEA